MFVCPSFFVFSVLGLRVRMGSVQSYFFLVHLYKVLKFVFLVKKVLTFCLACSLCSVGLCPILIQIPLPKKKGSF